MKKNSSHKIKTEKKSKPRSAAIAPVPKPRTKNPLFPTEQAEYINIIPPEEAAAACTAPLDDPSFYYNYSEDYPYDSAQIEYYPETQLALDLEQSEYANLFLQGETEGARVYVDPEGNPLTIPKRQTEYEAGAYSDNPYGESTQVAYYYPQAQQSFDSKQSESEYANLLFLGEAEKGERIYLDPESNYIAIPEKKTEHTASFSPAISEASSCISVAPMKAKKKRSKKPAMTPKIDEVQYATLGLTQSDYANVIQERKLETVEYYHLGPDNLLTPIPDQEEKQSKLTTKKPMIAPSLTRNRNVIKRKKNRSKDNYPGSLSTAFGKLDIATIQEEQTVESERKSDSAVNQTNRFSFFPKANEKNTESSVETGSSAYNFPSSSMQNK